MKNLLFGLFILISVSISSVQDTLGAIKPAYCYDALMRCYDLCKSYYSSDFYRNACYCGCFIAYLSCGH